MTVQPLSIEAYTDTAPFGRRAPSTIAQPSFRTSMDAWCRQGAYLSTTFGRPTFSQTLAGKLSQKDAYIAAEATVPRTRFGPGTLDDVLAYLAGALPDQRLLLKPAGGKNSWGVFPIDPIGRCFSVHPSTDAVPLSELAGRAADILTRTKLPDAWIVEDCITPLRGSPLVEIKSYALGGRTPCFLINTYDEGGKIGGWFDDRMASFDSGKPRAVNKLTSLPMSSDDFVRAVDFASSVSQRLPMPFCRVDYYFDGQSFFGGELTPFPGYYYAFSPGVDAYLGALFEAAAATLFRRMAEGDPVFTSFDSSTSILGY